MKTVQHLPVSWKKKLRSKPCSSIDLWKSIVHGMVDIEWLLLMHRYYSFVQLRRLISHPFPPRAPLPSLVIWSVTIGFYWNLIINKRMRNAVHKSEVILFSFNLGEVGPAPHYVLIFSKCDWLPLSFLLWVHLEW